MKEVYTPKSPHEKAMQRALIQYRNPKNYDLVLEALKLAGREDLIGYDKRCLIRPKEGRGGGGYAGQLSAKKNSKSGSKKSVQNGKNGVKTGTKATEKKEKLKKKKTIRNVHKKK